MNLIKVYNYLNLFFNLTAEKLLINIISIDSSKKESYILLLSAKYPSMGATMAKAILRIKLLTDITVALIFDFVLILI